MIKYLYRYKPRGLYVRIVKTLSIVFLSFLLFALPSNTQAINTPINNISAQVYFSPMGGCTDAIVQEISRAKTEILVQAYSFTSKHIAKALVAAHKRGVRTVIILDKNNQSKHYSAADFTFNMGIPTYIDAVHGIAHNKLIIIDRETVITGSFNFTKAAEQRNAENILILYSKELAERYIDNWNRHKLHSQEYKGRQ